MTARVRIRLSSSCGGQIVVPMKPLVSQDGASVSFKAYDDADGAWIAAGTTPLKDWVEAPRGALRLKVDEARLSHRRVRRRSARTFGPDRGAAEVSVRSAERAARARRRGQAAERHGVRAAHRRAGVSQRLVDESAGQRSARHRRVRDRAQRGDESRVQGIHRRRRLRSRAVLAGSEIRVPRADAAVAGGAQALRRFDGPAGTRGWQLSTYARGQDDLPVVGISWYEAVAYARFRKQMLPTIHHWMRAAFTPYDPMFPTAAAITKQSRFFADGPESARSEHGLGPWGTYHMAGNAREWVWNFAGGDAVALGSGWPEYASNFARVYTADPMARLPDHGLRLMSTLDDAPIEPALLEPIKLVRDTEFANRAPVSDDAFAAMRFQFTTPRAAPDGRESQSRRRVAAVDCRRGHAHVRGAGADDDLHRATEGARGAAAADRVLRRRRLLLHEASESRRARTAADRRVRREQRPRAGDADLGRRLRALRARTEAVGRGDGSRAPRVAGSGSTISAPRSTISKRGPTWTRSTSAISESAGARASRARSISRSSRASARPCSRPAASGSTARCIR